MLDDDVSPAEKRRRLAVWVAREVLPHERGVRLWLVRARIAQDDVDELIQEAYCRLAMLDRVDHISAPDAYFFSIVRNLLLRRLRRQRIVPLDTIAQIESWQDDRPSPERIVGGKIAYDKVLELIARLPERCQRIVRLRKLDGWSQRQIADHLGTTEKAVEKQIWLGIRAIRDAWSAAETEADQRLDLPEQREGIGR